MTATPQTQAITIVNQLISITQQLYSLSQDIGQINNRWATNGVATTLSAFATVSLNADGSLGTADATSNVAHPFSPVVYPSVNRAISSNQTAQLLTVLNSFVNFCNGSAIASSVGTPGILASVIGG